MFSNFLNVNRNGNSNDGQNNNHLMIMGFTRNNSRIYNQPAPIQIPEIQPSDAASMTWGAPTWFFLHTLAEKIHETDFQLIRIELLNIITMVISNLPCPLCSDHGKIYLKSVNYDNIRFKEDLKKMLFEFHNLVNLRKHYALFSYDDLTVKYKTAITINVCQNFLMHFSKKSGNIRLISEDLHRQVMLNGIRDFLHTKMKYFDY